MSKIKDRSNRLNKVNFVQDITSEIAANYSGGVSLAGAQSVFGGALISGEDPDLVIYQDANEGGFSLDINAATNRGIFELGTVDNDFANLLDNNISSFTIFRGQWRFFRDRFYGGGGTTRLGPGTYNVSSSFNDSISSIRRVAP